MELTIAIIGTITTIITIVLTNYFAKRNELRFSERKLKENYYLEYIKCVSNNDYQSVLDENKAYRDFFITPEKSLDFSGVTRLSYL